MLGSLLEVKIRINSQNIQNCVPLFHFIIVIWYFNNYAVPYAVKNYSLLWRAMGKHSTATSTPCAVRTTGKKTLLGKGVCVVMSCIWCAYSCSDVRRLLGQVLGFSPLCLSCHSWNNCWADYCHLVCFTPAFHSKAVFSSTLAYFFFTPLHRMSRNPEKSGCIKILLSTFALICFGKRFTFITEVTA